MPVEDGQITPEDCKAPEGQFRIVREDMDDGELILIADFYNQSLAEKVVAQLAEDDDKNVFTLWDDQGNGIL